MPLAVPDWDFYAFIIKPKLVELAPHALAIPAPLGVI